jgi:hypothetical protein
MSILCIIDGRRGPQDAGKVITGLIHTCSAETRAVYMVAAPECTDTTRRYVAELAGESAASKVHVAPTPPDARGGAHTVLATARAASTSILYRDRIISVWDSGTIGLPGWDTALVRACSGSTIVGCCATRDGQAGFTVPVAFQDGALVTETRGFLSTECGALQPMGLVPTLCFAARARGMGAVCTDAITLMGDTNLKLTQVGVLVTLAAHRARLRRRSLAVPVVARRYHAKIVHQWIHPEFRAMAGGGGLERDLGLDMVCQLLYGQGALGLTLAAGARECLAKTGMLRSELAGAPEGRSR